MALPAGTRFATFVGGEPRLVTLDEMRAAAGTAELEKQITDAAEEARARLDAVAGASKGGADAVRDQIAFVHGTIAAIQTDVAAVVDEAVPRIDGALRDADQRIADAGQRIDGARADLAAERDRAIGREEELDERITSVAAKGGYDDAAIYARVGEVDRARADGDRALAVRATAAEASYQRVASSDLPINMRDPGRWTHDESAENPAGLTPDNAGFIVNGEGIAVYATPPGADYALAPVAYFKPGRRTYRATFKLRRWVNPDPAGPGGQCHLGFWIKHPDGSNELSFHTVNILELSASATDYTLVTHEWKPNGSESWARPRIHFNAPGSIARFMLAGVTVEDVSDVRAVDARVTDMATAFADADRAIADRVDITEAKLAGTTDSGLRTQTNARIEDRATAIAEAKTAPVAQRVSTTEAQLAGTSDSGLRTAVNARIEDRATVIADAKVGPVAQRTGALEVRMDAVPGAIEARAQTAERAAATATGAVAGRTSVLEATARPGGNLVPNSALSTLDGWYFYNVAGGCTMELNRAGAPWMIGGVENNLTLHSPTDKGDGIYSEAYGPAFAVRPGSTIQFYALAMSHRARHWVSLLWLKPDGTPTPGYYAGENLGSRANEGGTNLNAWELVGRKAVVVPDDAVAAKLFVRQYGFTREADRYSWFTRPFACEVQPGTDTWATYAPGNDRPVSTAVAARLTTAEGTIADLPNRYTAVSRAAALEAQVNGEAGSRLLSRADERATAVADQKAGSVAQTVRQLRSEYDGTAATVSQQAGTIADVNYRTRAYIRSEAVAGNNRAQLALYADSNMGAGVDLTGDLSVSGNLLLGGSLGLGKLARSQFATYGQAEWSLPDGVRPAAGQKITLIDLLFGTVGDAGSIYWEVYASFVTNAGTSSFSPDYGGGRGLTTHYVADGGIGLNLMNGGAAVIGSVNPRTVENRLFYNYSGAFQGRLLADIFNNNQDSGIIDDGEVAYRNVSAYYHVYYVRIVARWTFV